MAIACAGPMLLALALVLVYIQQHDQGRTELETQRVARGAAAVVDRQLLAAEGIAQALAAQPALAGARNLPLPAEHHLLLTENGNPSLLAGSAMPLDRAANAARIRMPAAGRSAISLLPANGKEPARLALDVPLGRAAKAHSVLSVLLPPALLDRVAEEMRLPSGSVIAVLAPDGRVVARSGDDGRASGQPVGEALRGLATQVGYLRGADSPWSITVAGPAPDTLGILGGPFLALAALLLALVLGGFGAAALAARRIAGSIDALQQPAQALADSLPVEAPRVAFHEARLLGDTLLQLERNMTRHRQDLERLVEERTAQLENSNALLETIYATAPVGLSFVDTRLRILMINDYLAAFNGLPVNEHIGRRFDEVINDRNIVAQVNQAYRRVLATGESVPAAELTGNSSARPGRTSHFIAGYYPVYGADGSMVGITAMLMDISQQKEAEAALRRSKSLMKSVLEHMPAMVFVKDAQQLRFELLNRQGELLLGRPREDLLGKSDRDFFPPEQADAFQEADRQVLASGEVLEIGEEAMRSAGGEVRYLMTRKVALRDEQGVATHLLAISLDITDRKRADEALQKTSLSLARSTSFLHTVTENLPGIVAYWDAELRCRYANHFFLDWFGKPLEETMAEPIERVLPPRLLAEIRPHIDAVLNGSPQHFLRELELASGELRYVWINLIPDRDENGAVRGFYALGSDVSDLKRSELKLQEVNEQLVRARDRAEAASRAKSEFVANMSHEIRTPMNAITGLARLLEEAPLERRERSYVSKIQLATRSLLGVVNDVLDFSKIEAGQLQLEQAPFNLEQMLAATAILIANSAWDKGVEPVFEIAPTLPAEVVGDAKRLQQVLLNLLSNAIKFTERGEVVLDVRAAQGSADSLTLEFTVRDTGIGITPEQQTHMFDAFSQGDTSTSRRYGGTGMGLAIARRLADLMGGVISVESTLGKGSIFRFTCPLQHSAETGPPELAPVLRGRHVLVVEDNASARQALVRAGQAMDWTVRCAINAVEGLALLREHQGSAKPFDLLLVDSAMPGTDGIAMLVQARIAHDAAMPNVVMMASERASDDLLPLADSLQIDAVLSKPFTPSSLRAAALAALTGANQPAHPPSHTPLSGRLAGMRVLLVEDNEINQEMARYILLHCGALVEVASNGEIALDMLRDDPQRFDAVLMDLQMPVMDGFHATQAIRAMGLRTLPIVAMTANAMPEDRVRAIEAGVDAHVAKPIDVDEMIATLTRLAPLHPELAATPLAAAHSDGRPACVPGIDLDAALRRVAGNYAAFASLLKRFENSQGDAVREVRDCLAQDKRYAAAQVLHRLKGVAANLGADDVARLSAQAESAVAEGQDSSAAALLLALEQALAVVTTAARELPLPVQAPADNMPPGALPRALGDLLTLLKNSNMKALSAFKVLGPSLEQRCPDLLPGLAHAIETLDFASAEKMVQEMLKRKEVA
ncbi:PAS domain-containing protein [Pseudoduganella sp. DS3]|uniref:histidine kinase n=2 Tax=Pseudoduganella guangdongensis TaxID=2692179 RepID=A0A6N9HMG9_9BURK|nr:PAS domain-containing protein [Pseudoduganella guangdongensis]MYN04700.1 PAS domain-containing protein [Pseudoduganella guangdongensis]